MSTQELRRKQSDQAKTGHHHSLAQRWLEQANPLQGNGAHYGERRCVIGDTVWDLGAKVLRNAHRLGVLAV